MLFGKGLTNKHKRIVRSSVSKVGYFTSHTGGIREIIDVMALNVNTTVRQLMDRDTTGL
jgi:hypothetical protein